MKTGTKTSVGEIARRAGVSTTSASAALKNQPGIGPSTRKRILRIAKKLGYIPDPNIGNWMARVRGAKAKELLPIAWLNTTGSEDSFRVHRFATPLLEGARARALQLGYSLQEIWCNELGMTMRRLAKILYQRGIEGVIITHPARHFRLDWDRLASVSLGSSLLVPDLHQVSGDFSFNFQLALKSLKRLGYQRIGVCLGEEVNSYSHFTISAIAAATYSHPSHREQVPPLFHKHYAHSKTPSEYSGLSREAEMVAWLRRYKPDVIVGHDNRLKQWVEAAGYRVPEDIGIVHLAVDDDVLDWAGIFSQRREVGAAAVEWLVSQMRNHQYGIPKAPLQILMRGSWQDGITLRKLPRRA